MTPFRNTPRWIATAAALLLSTACAGEAPEADANDEAVRPKVIIIGIDGIRPDVLADVPTPNLDALADAGLFIDDARTGFPSVSGPGWSSMLNGVWPEKHGVLGNDFEDDRYDEYPDFLTRIEQVRPDLNTFAVADWRPLVASDDQRHPIGDGIDRKEVLDGYETGWAEGDSMSVELAVSHLSDADPDALFVYLGNPDEVSHGAGSIGQEYREAIALADRHVGMLIEAIQSRASYAAEDWLVLSSTDHGRTEQGGHGGDTPEERTIYLLASGSSVDPSLRPDAAFIVDVPVTALAHLGITIDPAWRLDGQPIGIR